MSTKAFTVAQQCINHIEDYLEYAYMAHATPRSLRDRIMVIIDDYAAEVSTPRNWPDSKDCG